jgi:DNA-binding NarL/FixJ family response regulator
LLAQWKRFTLRAVMIVPRLFDGELPALAVPRALIVGPYPLVLAAFARLLSGPPLNARVETTTRSDEAVDSALNGDFQLVLCDLRAEPVPGAELAARLTRLCESTRVILLAEAEDGPLLLTSLECGAAGFFTKDASADEFLEGVRAVRAGHYAVGRKLVRPVFAVLAGGPPADRNGQWNSLSPSERSILAMVGLAHSTRSIAAARGISPKTVRNHLANIYRKLELKNRSEAILWSARAQRSEHQ